MPVLFVCFSVPLPCKCILSINILYINECMCVFWQRFYRRLICIVVNVHFDGGFFLCALTVHVYVGLCAHEVCVVMLAGCVLCQSGPLMYIRQLLGPASKRSEIKLLFQQNGDCEIQFHARTLTHHCTVRTQVCYAHSQTGTRTHCQFLLFLALSLSRCIPQSALTFQLRGQITSQGMYSTGRVFLELLTQQQ